MKIAKSKLATVAIVFVTLTLAGIAIFTAIRLYQLRQEPVAPTAPSRPLAIFECTEYDLLIDVNGTVSIKNVSEGSRPTQNIELFVDGQTIGNFDIPALNPDEVEILGDLNLAPGDYNWSINGVPGCTEGGGDDVVESCQEVVIELASSDDGEPTLTPTTTPTSTPTPTPTTPPVGGGPTSTPTSTPKPTSSPTSTATPTSSQIAQASPTTAEQLPDAGISFPTVALSLFGALTIFFALALAL